MCYILATSAQQAQHFFSAEVAFRFADLISHEKADVFVFWVVFFNARAQNRLNLYLCPLAVMLYFT